MRSFTTSVFAAASLVAIFALQGCAGTADEGDSSSQDVVAARAMTITPESGDPGIKISAVTGNRVLVNGVAEGPEVHYLDGIYYEGGVRVHPVDYEVSRGVSFQVDHDKMPDFSQDADYTRKNQWYFAHLATIGTKHGQTALSVAQGLADALNKGGAYKATVASTADGAAISLAKL